VTRPVEYPRWKKLAIGSFIALHWFCVLGWLAPNPSPVKTAMLDVPLPGAGRPLAWSYLLVTAQFQDWAMFAPDPLQENRYLSVSERFADGSTRSAELPRVMRMSPLVSWFEKPESKYAQNMFEERPLPMRQDLARYWGRRLAEGAPTAPVEVTLYKHWAPIPRHDRPGANQPADYYHLLRDQGAYHVAPIVTLSLEDKTR
jgi:hypothetical protein